MIVMTDPIADMLNRIKNAQQVRKETTEIPFSRTKFEIGKILERTGFLQKVDLKTKRNRKPIEVTLKYKEKIPVIHGVQRISKSGQRVYVPVSQFGKFRRGLGIVIISTSKGLMTMGEAKEQNLGGEVLCKVW